jgi:hypothetical protein
LKRAVYCRNGLCASPKLCALSAGHSQRRAEMNQDKGRASVLLEQIDPPHVLLEYGPFAGHLGRQCCILLMDQVHLVEHFGLNAATGCCFFMISGRSYVTCSFVR